MWISSIEVRGLADVGDREYQRRDELTSVGEVDALALWALACAEKMHGPLVQWLDWAGPAEDGVAVQRHALTRCLQHPERDPCTISVALTLHPDPPLFGMLRAGVLRVPQLALGLADGFFRVKMGWAISRDRTLAFPNLLGLQIGESPVPLTELPEWVQPILSTLSTKVRVLDWREPLQRVLDRLAAADRAANPALRRRARRVLHALSRAPFSLPEVQIVGSNPVELALGPELRLLRWGGAQAEHGVRLLEMVFLQQPDILIVPQRLAPPVQALLFSLSTGEDAVLEQVLILGSE